MASIDDLYEVLHGLFNESIIGSIKLKDGGDMPSWKSSYLNEKPSNFNEIWYTTAHLELDDRQMTKCDNFKFQDGGWGVTKQYNLVPAKAGK